MSKVIGSQDEKWEIIEKGIDSLEQFSNALPQEIKKYINNLVLDIEEIRKITSVLKNEKFTISVCGVVKAGKSTFINSYLFGKEILPKYATPLTAKINIIEHIDKEHDRFNGKDYFEVNFYNKKEWDDLKKTYNNLSSSNDEDKDKLRYKEALEKSIEICYQRGINENNCIGKPPIPIDDLSKLGEYVADPSNEKYGAKYTPFVRDIHIYINNERIKNCRIVDTPGLYDPNPINSAETLKFLDKSHAIIFLLTKKGFTGQDEKLFETELRALKPEQRIFVLNRIDELNSFNEAEEVRKFIRDLGRDNEKYRNLRLFDSSESICLYSGIIDLIMKKQQNGILLTEKESKYLNKSFVKNPDPDKIYEKIENRLFSNSTKLKLKRGADIVTKKFNTLNDIIDGERVTIEERIDDCKKSEDELNAEIQSFKNIYEELIYLNEANVHECSSKIKKLVFELSNVTKSLLKSSVPNIDIISSNSDLRYVGTDLKNNINNIFARRGKFEQKIIETFEDFEKFLNDQADKIRDIFISHNISNRVVLRHLDDFNRTFDIEERTVHILDDMEKILDNILPYNVITEWLNPSNWGRDFKKEVREIVRKKLKEIEKSVEDILNDVENELIEYRKKNIDGIITAVLDEQAEKANSKKLKKDEKQQELQNLGSKLKMFNEISEKIGYKINEFKSSIEGVCEI